jgi:hypothetical protein
MRVIAKPPPVGARYPLPASPIGYAGGRWRFVHERRSTGKLGTIIEAARGARRLEYKLGSGLWIRRLIVKQTSSKKRHAKKGILDLRKNDSRPQALAISEHWPRLALPHERRHAQATALRIRRPIDLFGAGTIHRKTSRNRKKAAPLTRHHFAFSCVPSCDGRTHDNRLQI